MKRVRIYAFPFALTLLLVSSVARAQSSTSIQGWVLDPSGLPVGGAKVSLENVATSAKRNTISDEIGSYQFQQVAPGTYRITAEHNGIMSVTHNNVPLLVNSPLRLDLSLKVGAIDQRVDVSETLVPAINSVDATLGNTIESSQIMALPLDSRNVGGLLSLQPGVVYTGITDKSNPDTRSGAVTGARSDQTNINLDGADVNDQQTGEAFKIVIPVTLDSIQELRVVTANANAIQGRSSAGQVSLITRSGANQMHGSVYEYHRNSATSANSFFNNATVDPTTGETIERPKLIRNVFGASLGGPIQKNRLFFFFNFEDTITRSEEPQLRTVPSDTFRQGILRYPNSAGAVQTVTPQQLQAMDPLNIGVNAASLALLREYPVGNDPTQGGDGGLNFVGYRFNAPLNEDKPSWIGRLDYSTPDNRHNFFIRGQLADWKEDELPAQFPGQPSARAILTNSKGLAVGYIWNVGPTLLNDFRWGLTRQGLDATGAVTGPALQFVGLTNIRDFDTRNASRKLPTHNITDDVTWIRGSQTFRFGVNYRNVHNKVFAESKNPFYRSNDQLMRNNGRDVLPAGITTNASARQQYVRAQMALLGTISQVDMTYFYDLNGSALPAFHIPRREFINNELEWYVQDQWKVSRNITLTMGLRYSYFEPPYEKNGYQVRAAFDVNEWFAKRRDGGALGIPSNANPLLSFVLAGKANNAPPVFDPDKNNFAPRVAVAWSPSFEGGPLHFLLGDPGQSSIRAGVSVFYDKTGGTFPITTELNGAVGLSTLVRTAAFTYNYDTAPRFTGLENLTSIPAPPAPPGGFPVTLDSTNPNVRFTGFMVDTKLRTPYSTAFNLSISRQLPGNLTLEAAYVGRVAKNLLIQNDFTAPLINFKDPNSGQTWVDAAGILANLVDQGAVVTDVQPVPFFENVFAPMATSTLSATQAFYNNMKSGASNWTTVLRNLDNMAGGSTIYGRHTFAQQQFDWLPAWTNLGQSSYHSFQLAVHKRFLTGFQADFNYTLAKSLDNGSTVESEGQGIGQLLNAFDHRQSLGFSNFDVRHQINSNFVIDLPFGRNRRWGSSVSPALNTLVGGWRLTGVVRWRTGFPFDVRNCCFATDFAVKGPATLKPGVPLPEVKVTKSASGGPNIFPDPAAAYAAFQATAPGYSGSRNLFHGPGFFSLDTGIQKTFKVHEGHEIQFRWETFNLTNTTSFDGRPNSRGNRGIDSDQLAQASFGRLRSLAGGPRAMQFALRYQF
jgi:hypothetical protein